MKPWLICSRMALTGLALVLAAGCSKPLERSAGASLVPPSGFYLAAPSPKDNVPACPEAPAPYSGDLLFPSKYEGSDSARDKLNPQAAARYKRLTGDVRTLESGVSKLVGKYLEDGNIQYIQFWDPAVAAYAMNTLAVMALTDKKDEIKAGLNLGLKGYESLTTPAGASPNLLYGQGWVGVTKDNMADYNF